MKPFLRLCNIGASIRQMSNNIAEVSKINCDKNVAQIIHGAKMSETSACDDIREKALNLCKEYLNGAWRTITQDQFIVRKVSGGLSNLLYYCALPESHPPLDNEPTKVLLRLYGQTHGERVLETKYVTECVIFTLLSESNSGPRLYGIFPGGRLEEYIPARSLTVDDLVDDEISLMIAESVAQIHSMHVPISKEPRWLWDTMERWLRNIEDYLVKGEIPHKNLVMVEEIITHDIKQEVRWLRNYLSNIYSPVVFCHNDLQGGNILLKGKNNGAEEKNNLIIIDFEYSAYNYRGFDLANHLCETIYDYTNEEFPYFWAKPENYPSQEKQERFVRRYLTKLYGIDRVSDEEVNKVLDEIRAFTLASHMFWGLWSVVNATISTITFDYWGYGEARFAAYLHHKALLLEKDQNTLIHLDERVIPKPEAEDTLQISSPPSRSSSLIETN